MKEFIHKTTTEVYEFVFEEERGTICKLQKHRVTISFTDNKYCTCIIPFVNSQTTRLSKRQIEIIAEIHLLIADMEKQNIQKVDRYIPLVSFEKEKAPKQHTTATMDDVLNGIPVSIDEDEEDDEDEDYIDIGDVEEANHPHHGL